MLKLLLLTCIFAFIGCENPLSKNPQAENPPDPFVLYKEGFDIRTQFHLLPYNEYNLNSPSANLSDDGLVGIEALFTSEIGMKFLQFSLKEDINPGYTPKNLTFRYRSLYGTPGQVYIDEVSFLDEVGNKTYIRDTSLSVSKSGIYETIVLDTSSLNLELLKNRIIFSISLRVSWSVNSANKAVFHLDDIVFNY